MDLETSNWLRAARRATWTKGITLSDPVLNALTTLSIIAHRSPFGGEYDCPCLSRDWLQEMLETVHQREFQGRSFPCGLRTVTHNGIPQTRFRVIEVYDVNPEQHPPEGYAVQIQELLDYLTALDISSLPRQAATWYAIATIMDGEKDLLAATRRQIGAACQGTPYLKDALASAQSCLVSAGDLVTRLLAEQGNSYADWLVSAIDRHRPDVTVKDTPAFGL